MGILRQNVDLGSIADLPEAQNCSAIYAVCPGTGAANRLRSEVTKQDSSTRLYARKRPGGIPGVSGVYVEFPVVGR